MCAPGDGRDKPGLPATLRLIRMSLRPLSSMDRAPENVVKTAFSPRGSTRRLAGGWNVRAGDGRDKPGLPATLRLIRMSLRPLSSMDRAPENVGLHAAIGRRLECERRVTAGINPAYPQHCV